MHTEFILKLEAIILNQTDTKNSVSDIQERGDMTKDFFEGSVNALVTGYRIDTRDIATYNSISIEKINLLYK